MAWEKRKQMAKSYSSSSNNGNLCEWIKKTDDPLHILLNVITPRIHKRCCVTEISLWLPSIRQRRFQIHRYTSVQSQSHSQNVFLRWRCSYVLGILLTRDSMLVHFFPAIFNAKSKELYHFQFSFNVQVQFLSINEIGEIECGDAETKPNERR